MAGCTPGFRSETRETRSCSRSGWPPEQDNDVNAKTVRVSSNATHIHPQRAEEENSGAGQSADHAQHAKGRAHDMGEPFATKQFMERHDSVTHGMMDKQDRSSADEYLCEVSRLSGRMIQKMTRSSQKSGPTAGNKSGPTAGERADPQRVKRADQIVDVPVVKQRQALRIRTMQKTLVVPHVQPLIEWWTCLL